ncbi:MAG TPA: phage tail protein, partial [Franconibacter pulveris]|nr:phage tail protein [Franconibacter pulveris]
MTSLIKVPFASSGDKTAVPETDASGGVNMTQGYGQAYSLDPATDPSAKRIERDKMNWLFNLITSAVNEIQATGVAPFITSEDNGGSPFLYGKGAMVSLAGVVYQSLEA